MGSKQRTKAANYWPGGVARQPSNGVRVASFFSGGGGLDLGFEHAGFEVVFATDFDKSSCETLKLNSSRGSESKVHRGDIREIDLSKLPDRIQLVIGGPPCQSYSASGRRAGGAAGSLDPRGTLFEAYVKVIKHLRPTAFLFENVRGIFATNKGQDWMQIQQSFSALGYDLTFRILDACDYGLPQHRERVLLVGHKLDNDFLFPRPTNGPNSLENLSYETPSSAFEGLILEESTDDLFLDGGKYSHLLPLVPLGGNYLHFTAKRGYENPIFAYRSRFSDFLYKANPNEPTKTIIASPGKYTGPFHWNNRRFSIAEYKALQGFPQSYKFAGNRTEVVRQIGNSVSPLLANQMARAIAAQIFGVGDQNELLPTDEVLSFDQRKGKIARKTRAEHARIEADIKPTRRNHFAASSYKTMVFPQSKLVRDNVIVQRLEARHSVMSVYADETELPAVSMSLVIGDKSLALFPELNRGFRLDVNLFCNAEHGIQTMWNAVDDWVIRSSSFHSLFELYGHFTEPHPIFCIRSLKTHQSKPTYKFAEHIAVFENCSRYFPRAHLAKMFGKTFGTQTFAQLVEILRGFRFDIRCHETNIAIPPDLYMVCYPFTLPTRRQMNFSIKHPHRESGRELRASK